METVFTGIIQHIGQVRSAATAAGGALRLRIDLGPLAEGLAVGDSLAVDGACLTACRVSGREAEFDAVPETVSRTTLAGLRPGAKVNLERPLRADGRLDGHIVQGHIDGVAEVVRIDPAGPQRTVEFAAPHELTGEMVVKGSVAVAGVSLTLTAVADGRFAVALIPTTREKTTLGSLRVGGKVNVETDVLGKYVLRYLRQMGGTGPAPLNRASPGGVTLDKLREAGFA
jgi:riboflavin synthase